VSPSRRARNAGPAGPSEPRCRPGSLQTEWVWRNRGCTRAVGRAGPAVGAEPGVQAGALLEGSAARVVVGRHLVRTMVCSPRKHRALAVPARVPIGCPRSSTPQVFARLVAVRHDDLDKVVKPWQCLALRHLTNSQRFWLTPCLTRRYATQTVSICSAQITGRPSTSLFNDLPVCLLRQQRRAGVLRDKRRNVGLIESSTLGE
jgi:hypothetical protein